MLPKRHKNELTFGHIHLLSCGHDWGRDAFGVNHITGLSEDQLNELRDVWDEYREKIISDYRNRHGRGQKPLAYFIFEKYPTLTEGLKAYEEQEDTTEQRRFATEKAAFDADSG